ncbi:hypothetical protein DEU56DRAFT_792630 [Suillus clintonianus]|uniref:uncharacterized protein n=1 Tax=Suillus clintonianus TaxID=1904413 RepID=UPI001B8722A3|nr:uncharacterized protein DEU56DRAFT_792630 [Suillus clintonianus]KAG2142946.1 hypothetical protein DEU56DRAFT_792630 [Suillus clintonianus]
MMFTSRFALLALLTFLAGANAECAKCDTTLKVGTTTYTLVGNTLEHANGWTLCTYSDNAGDKVVCEYSNGGIIIDGDAVCPLTASVWC